MLEYSTLPIAGLFVLLDNEDVDRVMEHNWTASVEGYLGSSTAPGRGLHRFIIEAPEGVLVDHRSGKTWDNRRRNLRLATGGQNSWNSRGHRNSSSKFKGVSIVRRPYGTYWLAQIMVNGTQIRLGQSKCEETAARLYDAAAKVHFGEYARLNFS